ncbi:hypothetical protein FOA52_010223 [Chlamydomonas sp. UWO 241]|nr:hypothetical protein FOA52_010223 [Chlamydomonas sp. UWO 241]
MEPTGEASDASTTSLVDLGLQLNSVARWLPAIDCGRLAAVCCALRDVVQEDTPLWSAHLADNFGMNKAVGPRLEQHTSPRRAYAAWAATHSPFDAGCLPFVERAAGAWAHVEAFLSEHLPEVAASLRPPASAADVEALEDEIGCALPPALRVMYGFHDGQALRSDDAYDALREAVATNHPPNPALKREVDAGRDSLMSGLFGGYQFYDHIVCSRMLPLARIRKARAFINEVGMFHGAPPAGSCHLPFAASVDFKKVFAVCMENGSIRVSTNGDPVLAAPQPEGSTDGALRWFEEFSTRLSQGWYGVDTFTLPGRRGSSTDHTARGLCLFARVEAEGSPAEAAVTRGVRVRASPLYVPEISGRPDDPSSLFAYSVRFSLLGGEEQSATRVGRPPLASCQLLSRNWVIRDGDAQVVAVASGEGVIGMYPTLRPGEPEFVYQSCTMQAPNQLPGSMDGSFEFVEGTIRQPCGERWEVACPRFELRLPDFVF